MYNFFYSEKCLIFSTSTYSIDKKKKNFFYCVWIIISLTKCQFFMNSAFIECVCVCMYICITKYILKILILKYELKIQYI